MDVVPDCLQTVRADTTLCPRRISKPAVPSVANRVELLHSQSSLSLAVGKKARTCSGLSEFARHAAIMRAPPTMSVFWITSPRNNEANTAAHKGSVASSTLASALVTLPSAAVSPTRLAAVVTNPVHSTATATLRSKGSSLKTSKTNPGRANVSVPGLTRAVSASAHTAVVTAHTVTCMAVIGSAWLGFLAIIFSVRKKEVPKPTACSTDQKSPMPGPPRSPPAASNSKHPTPASARMAANHT
mmetsp:Transcript_31804/g.61265  ORF Transcript_31804/g.61265 Transcript_31804/m.61265 type:complete len:243 (-) Transcript_31804:847-1575(-)